MKVQDFTDELQKLLPDFDIERTQEKVLIKKDGKLIDTIHNFIIEAIPDALVKDGIMEGMKNKVIEVYVGGIQCN